MTKLLSRTFFAIFLTFCVYPAMAVTITLVKAGGTGKLVLSSGTYGNSLSDSGGTSNATLTCDGSYCYLPPVNVLTWNGSGSAIKKGEDNPGEDGFYWCTQPWGMGSCYETSGSTSHAIDSYITSSTTLYAAWYPAAGHYAPTASSYNCSVVGSGY